MRTHTGKTRQTARAGGVSRRTGWRRAAAGLLTLVLGASLPSRAQSDFSSAISESEALFQQGRQALSEGALPQAIERLSNAVARRPNELAYAVALAQAYIAAARWSDAESLLGTLERSHGDEQPLIETQAELDAARGRWSAVDQALSPLEERLSVSAALNLAMARNALDRGAEAVGVLRRATARLPEDARLWLALVDLILERDQNALAIRRVAEAAEHGHRGPEFAQRLAQAYLNQGAALGALSTVRVEDGRPGQFVRGGLLVEAAAAPDEFLCAPPESALYQIRKALDHGLNTPEARVLHARVWLAADRPRAALAVLGDLDNDSLHRADAGALHTIIDASLAAGDTAGAIRACGVFERRFGATRPSNARQAFLDIAEACNQRGLDCLYREFLGKAAAMTPDDMDLRLRLADALWDAGQKAQACESYRRLLRQAPLHAGRERALHRLAE